MKKYLPLLIALVIAAQWATAQDRSIFGHYNITPVLINGAAAGFDDMHRIQLNARAAWTSFPDAPKTYAVQYNGPLGDNFGIGVGVLTESAAQMERLRAHLNYAFRFDISKSVKMSAGFSADYQQMRLDDAVINSSLYENGDRLVDDFIQGEGLFDAAVGVFTSFNENTRVGLTFSNLVGTRTSNADESILQHYIFFASHKMNIYDYNFSFEPSVMVRNTRDVPSQLDINLMANFLDEALTAGLTYRSINSLGILLGTKLSNFRVLYSYDVFLRQFQRYNDGSHEVTVAISFDRKKEKTPQPKRY